MRVAENHDKKKKDLVQKTNWQRAEEWVGTAGKG